MSGELRTLDSKIIASLVLDGDMKGLTKPQQVEYYNFRCNQAGLDPSAKPFDLMVFQGKLVLYANKTCAEQLTAIHKLSHQITGREVVDGLYCVYARVSGPDGRFTENMGAANVEGLKGEARVNAMLKGTTKAIRRTVLAFCGLGELDETEVESLRAQGAVVGTIDDPPPVVPQVEWTDEERSAAAGMVADLAEALLEAGMAHEDMQWVIGKPSSKIGDPEMTLNTWTNRILTLRERELKKLEAV